MSGAGAVLWERATHQFPVEELDAFLLWAAAQDATDISFQNRAPAMIEIEGQLRRASAAVLDGLALLRLTERIYDITGEGLLLSGKAIDCSYAVAESRTRTRRFRCNLVGCQVANAFAINISMRVLPEEPPTFAELGIEREIVDAWESCRGLTLVTGVPGSGKSTLLAAGTRYLLEKGVGKIQSYEAPIEFVFDGLAGDSALMSSSEIPRNFPTFADGARSSLRRRPAAMIVGESRDRETVEVVVKAADTGIATFSTTHTIGVAATVRRMLAELPAEERNERGAALIDVMNMVVTQVLVPHPQQGRTALREWLVFDGALKAEVMERPQGQWPGIITAALAETGNDLVTAAEKAFREGRIGASDHRRIRASMATAGGLAAAPDNVATLRKQAGPEGDRQPRCGC